MPILALGPNGQLYATSPDREDGLGLGYEPECVDQSDLTLGSVYLKAQEQRRAETLRRYRQNQIMDAKDNAFQMRSRMIAFAKQKRDAAEARMYENPDMVEAITKKAHAQAMAGAHCPCEYRTQMSGNAMTHNGQSGWRGMSRDQQAIHHAVTGMGYNVAHAADPEEVRQLQHKLEAERILRVKARR